MAEFINSLISHESALPFLISLIMIEQLVAAMKAFIEQRDHRRSMTSVVQYGGGSMMLHLCFRYYETDEEPICRYLKPKRATDPHAVDPWEADVDLHAVDPWDIPGERTGSVGLEWAQRGQDIIHSDLKPGNILLSDTTSNISDFGLSRMYSPGYIEPADLYSVGLILQAVVVADYGFLNEAIRRRRPSSRFTTSTRRMPYSTRSSRSPEVYSDDVGVTDGQTTKRFVLKRESCTDALVSKGNHARPHNDLAIDSSKKGVVCQPSLGLNGSAETPIHQLEQGPVYSGGPDHPAAWDKSSITPTKISEAPWIVASSAAYHMTGDVNQLTDYTPTPGDLVVHVPSLGPVQVHGSGSVRTATISLENVLHVPGFDKNLVSISQLAKVGYTITLDPSGCRVTKDQTLVGKAHFTHDYLFELDFLRIPSIAN